MIKQFTTLTLGLVLTLSTMGSGNHETWSNQPDANASIRLASASRPASHPDGGSAHNGFHAKGCRGKYTAQSRATATHTSFTYTYTPGMARAAGRLRAAMTSYYTLCTYGHDHIRVNVARACITQLDAHPDHVYYSGTYIRGSAWDRHPGHSVDYPQILVPDDGDHTGETTCKRATIPKSDRHWMPRFMPNSKTPRLNVRWRFEGRVKIFMGPVTAEHTEFGAAPRWIDPTRDHRLH